MGINHSSRAEVYVHLVWATWDRLPMLPPGVRERVHNCLRGECARMGGDALAIGGIDDHVHLLVRLPPTVSLSAFVKQLKGASSHFANHEIKSNLTFKWQGGYGAFSVSRRLIPLVHDYILRQEEHHRTGAIYAEVEPV
jgi:putative transposase